MPSLTPCPQPGVLHTPTALESGIQTIQPLDIALMKVRDVIENIFDPDSFKLEAEGENTVHLCFTPENDTPDGSPGSVFKEEIEILGYSILSESIDPGTGEVTFEVKK